MKRLLTIALLLACVLVPLGAYVRLSDAGLGCPDWPGCYGQPTPLHAAAHIDQALAAAPDGPVSFAKAWKEMTHRYLAAALGLLLLAVVALAWQQRRARWLASGLLLLLLVQGVLGMLTVTLLLKPVVVTAHLLGGMSVVALLALWRWRPLVPVLPTRGLVWGLRLLPLLLLVQVGLGGWVSSNQAALACQGFPACNGAWWPPEAQFDGIFHWQRMLAESGQDGLLPVQRVAIHWLHRLGALVVAVTALLLVWRGWRYPRLRPRLAALLLALLLQLVLGAANVLLQLPLPLAVAHNAGAMLLLALSLNLALAVQLPRSRCGVLRADARAVLLR